MLEQTFQSPCAVKNTNNEAKNVIPGTREAEIRNILVLGQLGQEEPISINKPGSGGTGL